MHCSLFFAPSASSIRFHYTCSSQNIVRRSIIIISQLYNEPYRDFSFACFIIAVYSLIYTKYGSHLFLFKVFVFS